MPLIDEILITILRCPQCHGELSEDEARNGLRCDTCHLLYPVQDGIPIMMVDDAEKLEQETTNEPVPPVKPKKSKAAKSQ